MVHIIFPTLLLLLLLPTMIMMWMMGKVEGEPFLGPGLVSQLGLAPHTVHGAVLQDAGVGLFGLLLSCESSKYFGG